MLTRLILHDFVIIRHAEIEFSGGFCALTGETGAGKSLLVGAITLLAGGRAAAQMVRPPAGKAEVQAAFDIGKEPQVKAWLQQHALNQSDEEEDTLLVRRVIGAQKSAAYINGRQVTLAQLTEVMTMMIDICGQHAHYSLRDAAVHRALIDSYAGADAQAVAGAYRQWRDSAERHEQAQAQRQQTDAARAALTETLTELSALEFSADKWREMNAVLTRTANIGDLADGAAQILQCLQGDDRGGGAQPLLAQARRQLTAMAAHDETLAAHLPVIEDADSLLRDVARDIAGYADTLQPDPEAQAAAEDFIAACHAAARKYHVADPAQLDVFIADKQAALAALPGAEDIDALGRAAAAAKAELDERCRRLSRQRRAGGDKLCAEVNKLLAQLAMPKARLSLLLTPLDAPTARGAEKVALQIVTRDNMPPGSIGGVASGGELSRLGLAIQIAAGQARRFSAAVFDEVDAGIGGAAAGTVGGLLRRLGETRQVLCVTHLPQVAAQAQAHWRVGGGEELSVSPLSRAERIEEIARMQSGEAVTDAARHYAEELLGE